jgi:hypothetical protein
MFPAGSAVSSTSQHGVRRKGSCLRRVSRIFLRLSATVNVDLSEFLWILPILSLQALDYGFLPPSDADLDEEEIAALRAEKAIKDAWRRKYSESVARQVQKWNKRLAKEHRYDKLPNLKEICRLGIPAMRRGPAWFAISGAQELYRADPHGFGKFLSDSIHLCGSM